MPERDGYIPGVPCWIDTSQPDPKAAAAFYEGLFGWEVEDVMPPEAPASYFMARIRGGDVAAISSMPEGGPPHAVWNTYIWVDSADETAAKVREAGGTLFMEPFDVMDAGRMEGFADVVASINPIPGDQPDTPPHWSVTFGVDDADAIAARATELGGRVLVPPVDGPWVRMTVISDPQGATFIANKFVAENRDAGAEAGAVGQP